MSYDCYCDYDPAAIYKARVHTSRKDRRCEECGRGIAKGTRYERVDGLYEGYWFTFFTCEPCMDLRQWVKNSVPCFCWEHGNMIDAAKEAVSEAHWRASDEVVGLRMGFLRRLHKVERAPRVSP